MKEGPNIARIAALLGDRARAEALTALMTGTALTATELAAVAGVTKQTMSTHLSKLLDAALIDVDQQGRHRYFRLADEDVARLVESLMGVAFRTGSVRLIFLSKRPCLAKGAILLRPPCRGTWRSAYEALLHHGVIEVTNAGLRLTGPGVEWFARIGIDADAVAQQRRTFCRPCMDWSERRHHLAGSLGAAMLARFSQLGWLSRRRNSRAIRFTPQGERKLQALFRPHGARAAKPA